MPKYWLISDRDKGGTGSGRNVQGLAYFVSDSGGPLSDIANWRKVSPAQFRTLLAAAADQFPVLAHGEHENQSHVTLLVHGFNVGFASAASFYEDFCGRLFDGPDSLGLCVLYDWPSLGSLLGYEPDRSHARLCAEDLADILSELFSWITKKQQATIDSGGTPFVACKAKVSVVAHSMGNYILQKAMHVVWTRNNQPLLTSLINQLVMVAADVDNSLFDDGAPDDDDGNAIANLTYRVTALYTGRDPVLGVSSGLKHFGTRCLGRSGLANRPPLVAVLPATDNVWDIDCSTFFPKAAGGIEIHGAYFGSKNAPDGTIELMRHILRGTDRGVLETLGVTKGSAWPG